MGRFGSDPFKGKPKKVDLPTPEELKRKMEEKQRIQDTMTTTTKKKKEKKLE